MAVPSKPETSNGIARAHTLEVLARIAEGNPRLQAFIRVTDQQALAATEASDARRAAGESFGEIDGLTVAIKDNIDIAGLPTSAGVAHYRGAVASADAQGPIVPPPPDSANTSPEPKP